MNLNEIVFLLLDTDDTKRKEAEDSFWEIVHNDLENSVSELLDIITDGRTSRERVLSLILLKIVVLYKEYGNVIIANPDFHQKIADKFLILLETLSFPSEHLNLLSEVVGIITEQFIDLECYGQLYQQMFLLAHQFLENGNFNQLVHVLNSLCFVTKLKRVEPNYHFLQEIFETAFTENSPHEYGCVCIRLMYHIVGRPEYPEFVKEYPEKIIDYIASVQGPLVSLMLIQLALFIANTPLYFISVIEKITTVCIGFAGNAEIDSPIRLNAIEVILKLAQKYDEQILEYLPPIIECFFQIICETDETRFEQPDELSIPEIVETDLSCLSIRRELQPNFTEIILEIFDQNSDVEEWPIRYASLVAIEKCLDGGNYLDESTAHALGERLIDHFTDENEFCRAAAFYAFAQFTSSFSPLLEEQHSELIQAYLDVIGAETSQYAIAAEILSLSVYSEHSSFEALCESAPSVISICIALADENNPVLANAILRCFNAYASKLGGELSDFYGDIIEWVKSILSSEAAPDSAALRARAAEAFAYIGSCVDREAFSEDAGWFVQEALSEDWSDWSTEETAQTQIALGKIAAIHYEYIEPVCARLLDVVGHRPEFTPRSPNEPNFTVSLDNIVLMTERGILEMNRNNARIYDSAITALCTIMSRVGGLFLPYAREFSRCAAPACMWFFLPYAQLNALNALMRTAALYAAHIPVAADDYMEHMISQVLQMLELVNEPCVLCKMFDVLAYGLTWLIQRKKEEDIGPLLECVPRMVECVQSSPGHMQEAEGALAALFLVLFQHFGDTMCAFFQANMAHQMPIDSEQPSILSLSCWTSFVRSNREGDVNVVEVVEMLKRAAQNESVPIAAEAFYCIESLVDAEALDPDLVRDCLGLAYSALEALSESEEARPAVDAILYLMTTIMCVYDTIDDIDHCREVWLSALPYVTIRPENSSVSLYIYFADVLGSDMLELNEWTVGRIVSIIAAVLETPLIDIEIGQRFKRYLSDMLGEPAHSALFRAAIAALPEELRGKISKLLSE